MFKRLILALVTRIKIFIYGMYNPIWYPKNILMMIKNLDLEKKNKNNLIKSFSFLKDLNFIEHNHDLSEVIIMGKLINIDEFKEIWFESRKSNYDSEILNASHRFHWVIEKIAEGLSRNDINEILDIIEDWIDKSESFEDSICYAPYNISERICNLSLFFLFLEKKNFLTDAALNRYRDFIRLEIILLVNCLEYPASGIVNNHILNNARALYQGSFFIGDEETKEVAREIFRLHVPNMIGKDGMLKESSSHYQLLLTRSIGEVLLISKEDEDHRFSEWIQEIFISMCGACLSLSSCLNSKTFLLPSIGDISPDIPINWFIPMAGGNHGWNNVWKFPEGLSIEKTNLDSWIIKENNDWKCVCYINTSSYYPTNHGHDDFGSLVLMYRGKNIFIDPGRFSYDGNTDVDYIGNERKSHSVLVFSVPNLISLLHAFDGLLKEFLISKRNFMESRGNLIWIWSNFGKKWKRSINLNSFGIDITDEYNSSDFTGYLYLARELVILEKNENNIVMSNDDNTFELKFTNLDNLIIEKAMYFPQYGYKDETLRIAWKGKKNSPLSSLVSLRVLI